MGWKLMRIQRIDRNFDFSFWQEYEGVDEICVQKAGRFLQMLQDS
jgi:hypothetical protein